MSRARRWFVAVAALTLFAGCASSSDVGGDTFTGEDALWTCIYIGAFILGVVGAKALVDSHE